MKKSYLLLAAAGLAGLAGYQYRDRLLAAMLGFLGKLQGLGDDPQLEEDEVERSFHYPKVEEDLDARGSA